MREWKARKRTLRMLFVAAVALGVGCQSASTPSGRWLPQEPAARWDAVANHLRGLDVAMVEIGYRYGELNWGALDENWGYADYQVKKVRLALENALERRPKRRTSTELTFIPALDEMARVVQEHDAARFGETFEQMTSACNACHAAEEVPGFYVVAPNVRYSPIRGEPNERAPGRP